MTTAALALLGALLLLGTGRSQKAAATYRDVPQRMISGTFEGRAEDGEKIVFNLGQSGDVVHGSGSNGGYPLVIGGTATWSAFTTLTQQDGSVSPAYLSLSGDGDALTVRRRGLPDLVLGRSEAEPATPAAEGPLSGVYEGHEAGKLAGTASIVQQKDLIYGMAEILGEAAGVSARLVESDRAEGILTFLDRSQIQFVAEFSDDGESVVLRGLGAPIDLKKVEGATP